MEDGRFAWLMRNWMPDRFTLMLDYKTMDEAFLIDCASRNLSVWRLKGTMSSKKDK